jgi:hypothetical protein
MRIGVQVQTYGLQSEQRCNAENEHGAG